MISLDQARERFQHAVKAGAYDQAQSCLAKYVGTVQEALGAANRPDPRAIETVRSALDLLHWGTRVVRAGRAHDAAKLARLKAGDPYRARAPRPAARFQVEG